MKAFQKDLFIFYVCKIYGCLANVAILNEKVATPYGKCEVE
jgi:hypothetical protein